MVRFVKPEGITRWQWMIQRYWEKVDKRGPDECWPWLGACVTDGYGTIAYEGREIYATHRLAYILEHGKVPNGLWVLHTCDNPPCCNPKHLYAGTSINNIQDRIDRKRGGEKLTPEQVEEIKMDQRKQKLIAKDHGISQSMVSRIKQGHRWHNWREA